MKKKLIIVSIFIIILLGGAGICIINTVVKNLPSSDHLNIEKKIQSKDKEYVAILYSYSTTTTPYRMGISILDKDMGNKFEKKDTKGKEKILFNRNYQVLSIQNIHDDEANIEWIDNKILKIKFNNIIGASNDNILHKVNSYKDIEIKYNE